MEIDNCRDLDKHFTQYDFGILPRGITVPETKKGKNALSNKRSELFHWHYTNYTRNNPSEEAWKMECKKAKGNYNMDTNVMIYNSFCKHSYIKTCYACKKGTVQFIWRDEIIQPEIDGRSYQQGSYYRPHYVCFDCKRAWKPTMCSRKNYSADNGIMYFQNPISNCAVCSKPGTFVGMNCRVPAKKDHRGWIRLQTAINTGMVFDTKCTCKLITM